jgi:protease-4
MSLDADAILDRRRLKRRLFAWRLAAIAAIVIAALTGIFGGRDLARGDHVAAVDVHGIIVDDAERSMLLQRLAGDDSVRAVIVRIDSPGGTTVGGEALYQDLRNLADHKPVVGLVRTFGTSAAYLAAMATDRIFAMETSLTGSIGVLLQTAQFTGLLEKIGVSTDAIKSGPLKNQPSPLEPLDPAARAATQAVIDDAHRWFVSLVAERRNLAPDALGKATDGRLFTGRQALDAGLVDAIGDERAARAWLAEAQGVPATLPIRAMDADDTDALLDRIGGWIGKKSFSERLKLDGLISLWHPQGMF